MFVGGRCSCEAPPPTTPNIDAPVKHPPYFRRVASNRWVVQGTPFALEQLPHGTFQFFSSGKPAFVVTTLLEADQALTDLLDSEAPL